MNVREPALLVLDRIEKSKSYSNIAIDTVLKQQDLSSKDRALFCRLVYGVIERKITLDYLIAQLSDLPMEKIEPSALNLLRMGLYQLAFLDRIPAHAALNETVALAPKRSRGFVNAILRSYQRQKDSLSLPKKEQDFVRYLSVTYSYPEPLCEKLIAQYGETETETILGAFNRIPPMTVRTNTLKLSREELLARLEEKGLAVSPTKNTPQGIRIENASPSDVLLDDGLCFVQDEASQIATAVLDARAGDTVYDICACPGSKSFGAAMTMQNTGSITCFDIHENKLSLVRSSAERLGITIIKTEARDGRDFSEALSEQADKIICDVPCSGFGVVAKKPEIRYKDVESSLSLRDIQYDILNNACRYVKKGGVLVYSTCTVFEEENESNIKRFLGEHPDFSPVPFTVGNIHALDGMLTLLPHVHDTDGFFVAKLQRKDIP